jgi:diacylglycerol O-acyltransferase
VSERAPLTPVDRTWLRMERPDNLMMITGVLTFDGPLDAERLDALLRHRLTYFPRFTRKVVDGAWVPDEEFELSRHVHHETLAEPADREALRERISALVSTPVDAGRPLWSMHVIHNPRDERTVLLARIHHCIADGFALLYVLLGLTDPAPDTPVERPIEPAKNPVGVGLRRSASQLLAAGKSALDALKAIPARELLKRAGEVSGDLLHLATLSSQPKTRLRGALGPAKRAAWSAPVPVDEVKAIGRAYGGATINDVLMAAVAGALRTYLVTHGESLGRDLRTVIPVNLREGDELKALGNHFGLVFLELPVGEADGRERLRLVKARMDRLKRSPEAFVLWRLMQLTGVSPKWVEDLVVRLLGAKTTGVLTNVPGPREPRYLAGERIRTIMFWVPQTGRVGLGVSIFSYAGEVRLGLSVDAGLIPDPETVLDAFPRELVRLADAVAR